MHLMTLVEILEQEIDCSTSERSKLADLLAERGSDERAVLRGARNGRPSARNGRPSAKPGR